MFQLILSFSTYVDNQRILYIPTPGNGFWNWGGFGGANIWASGGRNAPFDQAVRPFNCNESIQKFNA
jgi:hypothetical protein